MIPAVLALMMFLFIREKQGPRAQKAREPFWKNVHALDGRLKLYVAVSALFTLGNSSNTFLLLRAKNAGFTDTSVILLYFLYSLTASVLALPLGRLSDRIGRKHLLVAGDLLFSLVYFGFAFVTDSVAMTAIFAVYGLYTAMTAGVERAFIAEISPPHLKGTMLGLQSTVTGICLLPASSIAGLLWNRLGAAAPFLYGGVMSLSAAVLLGLFLRPGRGAAA
jgi:MFS family permease